MIPKVDDTQRCGSCEEHRPTLNRILYRMVNEQGRDQDRTACSSHTNYCYLTLDDASERLKQHHQEVVQSRREIGQLRGRIEKLIEGRSIPVEKDLDDHLTEITSAKSGKI